MMRRLIWVPGLFWLFPVWVWVLQSGKCPTVPFTLWHAAYSAIQIIIPLWYMGMMG